jgi:DDE superfamily endonuclease
VNQKTREVICTAIGKGREHDFKLFKRCQMKISPEIEFLGDRGYQGLQHLHSKSQTPQKKPRGGELSRAERNNNRELASRRVVGEHVIGKLKVFRILSEKYRNRRRRFGLRLNLIASIYNHELRVTK